MDFRKPFARHREETYASRTKRMHDFPIFNGKYSTLCYLDATVRALDEMFERIGGSRRDFYNSVRAIACHRPYEHMPLQAVAAALVWGTVRDDATGDEVAKLCEGTELDPAKVRAEVENTPDVFETLRKDGPSAEPFPTFLALVKQYRRSPEFKAFVADKLSLGSEIVRDLGNLYTAALPAWLGAAFEDAYGREEDLAGASMLTLGYGSGMRPRPFRSASPSGGGTRPANSRLPRPSRAPSISPGSSTKPCTTVRPSTACPGRKGFRRQPGRGPLRPRLSGLGDRVLRVPGLAARARCSLTASTPRARLPGA